jgi:hypothetical protein
MKERYASLLEDPALWEEPKEPEEPPKTPFERSPPKIKKRTPGKEPEKKEPEQKVRPRHKPPKKAKGQIQKIGVVGDEFDILTAFGTASFEVYVKDKKNRIQANPNRYEFTEDLDDEEVNVVVFGFDASRPDSISGLRAKGVPEGALIYAIGINAEKIKPLERAKMSRKLQKALSGIQHTFYLDDYSEAEMIGGLVDVAIDVEALRISGYTWKL